MVELITDGGCSPNPGAGSWAALLRFGGVEKEISGFEANSTNNRMELRAVIEGLRSLKRASAVKITTDSQYVMQGMTSWIAGWKRNGWRTSAKKPVLNVDLWQELDALVQGHQVQWHWVRGHNGHVDNERVDELVRKARLAASNQPLSAQR